MSINLNVLYRHFPLDDINGLAEGVLNRIDELTDDVYEDIWQAMNDELIYTEDQWIMIKSYCTPQEADFNYAWESFEADLIQAINDGVLEAE